MAAAAALARLEQKQPKARGPTSQESIRNQGELWRPPRPGGEVERGLCLAPGRSDYMTSSSGGLEVSAVRAGGARALGSGSLKRGEGSRDRVAIRRSGEA